MLNTRRVILFIVLPTYLLVFSVGYLIARWNRSHAIKTLGLAPKALAPSIASPAEGPRTLLALFASLIFLPALPLLALLSIPCFWIWAQVRKRRESEFAKRMGLSARTISWAEAKRHAIAKEGTLICELLWLNGPPRLWSTPDVLANLAPFPFVHSADKNKHCFAQEFQAFGKWCFENYTHPTSGRAVLVELPAMKPRQFWKQVEDAGY